MNGVVSDEEYAVEYMTGLAVSKASLQAMAYFHAVSDAANFAALKEHLLLEADKLAAACVQAVLGNAGDRAVNMLVVQLSEVMGTVQELSFDEARRIRAAGLAWSKLRKFWTRSPLEFEREADAKADVLSCAQRVAKFRAIRRNHAMYSAGDVMQAEKDEWDAWTDLFYRSWTPFWQPLRESFW